MKSITAAFVALSFSALAFAAVPLYGQCGGNGHTGEVVSDGQLLPNILPLTSRVRLPVSPERLASSKTSGSGPAPSNPPSTPTSTSPSTPTGGGASPNGLIGYGAGTTGGGNASPQTVTSCSALSSAVGSSSPAVIRINGLLSGCGIIDIKADKTIIGVGSNSGLTNGGFRIRRVSNVIIRNVKFHVAPPKGDLLALDQGTRVWIDHCEFSSIGMVGGKDDYDGLLDITHASDFVTVSWCKFSDHWKGSLIGHSDNNASEDTGKLRVTYHHNQWNNVNSRTPSLRFGTLHVFNSVYTNVPTSGVNSRMGAQALVENTIFNNVKLAIVTDLDSDLEGRAVSRNNVFSGSSTTRITQTGSLSPPYSYSLDSTSNLASIVSSGAGVGKISI
ncbi:hypothetical protein ONZ45_g5874 [Pleurotus djamor]|nr:hypothetical protein ONZ45_g5874 [Pleurotus djamor]